MDVMHIVLTAVFTFLFGLLSLIIFGFWDYMWSPFKVAHDMDLLRKRMDILKNKFKDVNVELIEAMVEQKTCIHEVKDWMKRVKSVEGDVNRIDTEYRNWASDYPGFYSYLYFWKRISISFEVFRKLKEVTDLRDQAAAFKDVATKMPHPEAEEMPSTPRVLQSMESNRDQILDHLRNNNEVEIFGIWGMGGVGKTTLLRIINDYFALHNGLRAFDHVIFVKALKNISLKDLRVRILENLASNGSSNINGGDILSFMKEKKVLLLLDNLWEFVDLRRLGIPLGQGKCKVVFTTRDEQVCHSMQAGIPPLKIECLNKEEAWILFKENVGENIIDSDPNIGLIAKEVAKECCGLPLALVTIGRAMCEKKTWREWQDGLWLLRNSKHEEISDILEKMFPILEFSYQNLQNDMMRQCFLSCSLWPEDSVIDRDELITCWMGLELIDDYNEINEAFDRGHTIIETLVGKCLLECDPQTHCVKMHDVLRDLALWIATDRGKAKKKWIVKATKWTQRWVVDEWESAERISVMDCLGRSLPENPLNCPRLSVLIMRGLGCDSIPGGHFQRWSALTYLDLSYSRSLTCLPTEMAKLVNLKFLNLEGTSITCFPSAFCGQRLKHLFLGHTPISKIPWGFISQLSMLKMLDLYFCEVYLEQDGLKALAKLEKLGGDLMALGINVSTLGALNRLSMLKTVSIVKLLINNLNLDCLKLLAPDVLGNKATGGSLKVLAIMNCGNLKELIVNSLHIGVVPREPIFQRLEILDLCYLPLEKIVWSGVTAKMFLPSLRELYIGNCHKLKNVSWVSNLPDLDCLHLSLCVGLEEVIDDGEDGEEEEPMSMFPRLTNLVLTNLPNFRRICRIGPHFPSLQSLIVTDCSNLSKLPFQESNIPKNLRKIRGPIEWWEQLEWRDDNTKTMLQYYYVDFP